MAFKPFEKAPAKGKVPVKPMAPKGPGAKPAGKPFAKGGPVKKSGRGC